MKRNNVLIQLIAGLMLMVAGIYWLFQQVTVTSGFGFHMWGMNVEGGLIVVPFIIGIVWVFVNPQSLGAKIVIGLGIFIIIASIIANTHFYFRSTSLYTYLIILVCIFGGLGLTLRVLFGNSKSKKDDDDIDDIINKYDLNNKDNKKNKR